MTGALAPGGADRWFWRRVDIRGPDECWPWTGQRTKRGGYGKVKVAGRFHGAHRVAQRLATGLVPAGWVLHSCDNPPCCNPAHLRVGTNADNVRDKVARGRCPKRQGTLNPRARLTDRDVLAIRASDEPRAALACRYGVNPRTIRAIIAGRSWGHLPGAHPCGRRSTGAEAVQR